VALLTERLQAARKGLFVGRAAERALFETALTAAEPPFCVLHVFGLGGVGKTTLLREFATLCKTHNVHCVTLDGRNIDPSPEGFLSTLALACGLSPTESVTDFLAERDGLSVLFIDTYELLAPLDNWLREQFLPQLPDRVLVVLAGRNAPRRAWQLDSGWQSLLRTLPLRNLSRKEGQAYLRQRNVPEKQHQSILDFTFGHPLALSIVADLFAQQRFDTQNREIFTPEGAPDIVKVLVEHLVQEVPSKRHRAAIEVCALVRLTTESLLHEMLPQADRGEPSTHELFDWLRALSFIEVGPAGIFPHDLAREAIVADLRWRDPQWYAELHQRARNYYAAQLQQSSEHQQQNVLVDYIFLHRSNSVVRPFLEWQENGNLVPAAANPDDIPALIAMVEKHEGAESARIAQHWFEQQPNRVLVLRDGAGAIAGFLGQVALHEATAENLARDPAAQAACNYLRQNAPLRAGESALLFRFWMASDTYQEVSPAQSLVFVNIVRQYLTTPGLAFTFLACADPEFWAPIFAYANAERLQTADFEVGGRHYGVYGHDWRLVPPMAWLGLMADQETAPSLERPAPPPAAEQLVVLSEPEFTAAVQDAMRYLLRPASLKNNPLLRSRLVVERAAGTSMEQRIEALQELIKSTCQLLQQSPRSTKFYAAVHHTYLHPAPSQEQAAELLDIPFSTFRRHLKSGVLQVSETLWLQEIGG
jgi:hypothetical protein